MFIVYNLNFFIFIIKTTNNLSKYNSLNVISGKLTKVYIKGHISAKNCSLLFMVIMTISIIFTVIQ